MYEKEQPGDANHITVRLFTVQSVNQVSGSKKIIEMAPLGGAKAIFRKKARITGRGQKGRHDLN